jgi:hypothetical protein
MRDTGFRELFPGAQDTSVALPEDESGLYSIDLRDQPSLTFSIV